MAIIDKNTDGTFSNGDSTMAPAAVKSPYDTFGTAMVNLLGWAKNSTSDANTKLMTQKEGLTNTGLNVANPLKDTPYAPLLAMQGPNATASEAGAESAMAPGITSVTDQMTLNNNAMSNVNEAAKTALAIKGTYTPSINPTTGLPDGFNTTTGTWASTDNAPVPTGSTGTHPETGSSLVGGVDFTGAATSTQPYATDPNYTTEVSGLYKSLTSTMPQATVANLDTYIGSHASKSPVTGQMVLNAANTYGVDPLLLTAVLAHESDFGTAGRGATTQNPGNVGNTDNGSSRTFNSWQAGVNAAASELARRMPGNTNAPAKSSPVGGKFSDVAASKVASLPSYMQPFVDAGPSGVAYINSTKLSGLPQGTVSAIQTQAAKQGIPYMDAMDVANLKSIQTVQEQIKNMSADINSTLGSGTMGAIKDKFLAPINEWLQTDWGNQLRKLSSYRDTAIKAVQALAGGQGSGLRINTGEIIANTNSFLPSPTDSIQGAQVGLAQLTSYLNQQLATTFPYLGANGGATGGTAGAGNLVTMTGPKGTFQVTPDKVAVMQQNGYATQ